MRTDYLNDDIISAILAALTPPNRLALIVSLTTGLRIGDVLALRTEQVRKRRFTVCESKTGKKRRITLGAELTDELLRHAGKIYVFEHRLDYRKHRTRQALWADIKRASKAFRLKLCAAPHSARKIYAVKQYKRTCDIKYVQRLLNHASEAVTWLYAAADELTARKKL